MKQDPNQIWILVLVGAFLACILVMQIVNNFFIVETNRLLSTFQRMDVVKESPLADAIPYQPKSVLYPIEKCEPATPTKLGCIKMGDDRSMDTQNDPNLCYHWKSDCDGEQCDVTCHLQKED